MFRRIKTLINNLYDQIKKMIWLISHLHSGILRYALPVGFMKIIQIGVLGIVSTYIYSQVNAKVVQSITVLEVDPTLIYYLIGYGGFLFFETISYTITNHLDYVLDKVVQVDYDKKLTDKLSGMNPAIFEDSRFVTEYEKLSWNAWRVRSLINQLPSLAGSLVNLVLSISLLSTLPIIVILLILVRVITEFIYGYYFTNSVWSIWDAESEEKVKYSSYRNIIFENDKDKVLINSIMNFINFFLYKIKGYSR